MKTTKDLHTHKRLQCWDRTVLLLSGFKSTRVCLHPPSSSDLRRAVDNQVYVATASPARDESASYISWGHSTVVNPWWENPVRMSMFGCLKSQRKKAESLSWPRFALDPVVSFPSLRFPSVCRVSLRMPER